MSPPVRWPEVGTSRDESGADDVVRVFRMLYAKVGNRADAEDLTTEVFLAAFGTLGAGASRGDVRVSLAAAARASLARYWRARLGVEVTHLDADLAAAALDDEPPASPAPVQVQAVLGALPERHRQVLELRFLEERSVRDVAREMGISVVNVRLLQRHALCMAARAGEGGAP